MNRKIPSLFTALKLASILMLYLAAWLFFWMNAWMGPYHTLGLVGGSLTLFVGVTDGIYFIITS